MEKINEHAIFFDFDNTLIKVNSLFYFLIYYRKRPVIFEIVMFFGFLALRSFSIVSALKSKDWRKNLKSVFWQYASFESEKHMHTVLLNFFRDEIEHIVDPNIISSIKKFNNDFDLYIISASPNCVIQAFSDAFDEIYQIRFLSYGSDTSYISSEKTIRFEKNLRGTKKKVLAEKILRESQYKHSVAFGDSASDLHILSSCTTGFVGPDVAEHIVLMAKKH